MNNALRIIISSEKCCIVIVNDDIFYGNNLKFGLQNTESLLETNSITMGLFSGRGWIKVINNNISAMIDDNVTRNKNGFYTRLYYTCALTNTITI